MPLKQIVKIFYHFILPEVYFTLLNTNPNSSKIVKFFYDLEETIETENLIGLVPVILTDSDSCFSNIEEWCKLFFCNPYVSNQKPNLENINK